MSAIFLNGLVRATWGGDFGETPEPAPTTLQEIYDANQDDLETRFDILNFSASDDRELILPGFCGEYLRLEKV